MRIKIVMVAICVLLGTLTGCKANPEPTPDYSVEVRTEAGRPLENVTVQAFRADSAAPVASAITDETGMAFFSLEGEGPYTVRVQDLPAGHHAQEEYPLHGALHIRVQTRLLTGSERNQISVLKVGDVMFDFDVKLTTGEEVSLGQILSEKKLVMLNFWFADCGYCTMEFPAIKQAYLQNSEQVEVIALSPYDALDAVTRYKNRYDLPFPMANCHASWPRAFGIADYPTTILVDRYGVICAIHTGAVPDAQVFANAFAYFTAEDYTQQLFDSLQEVG